MFSLIMTLAFFDFELDVSSYDGDRRAGILSFSFLSKNLFQPDFPQLFACLIKLYPCTRFDSWKYPLFDVGIFDDLE